MAKLYAPLNGAWEVLAFSAMAALLVVLAKRGSMALPALTRELIVLAVDNGVAQPTYLALLVVRAEAGPPTRPTLIGPLPMWTLVANAPLYRGRLRHSCNCRSLHETLWRVVHVCYRLRT